MIVLLVIDIFIELLGNLKRYYDFSEATIAVGNNHRPVTHLIAVEDYEMGD